MSIEFDCPQCRYHIKAADEHAGRRGKCASCGASLLVPEPVSVEATLSVDDDLSDFSQVPIPAAEPRWDSALDQIASAPKTNLQGCPDCSGLVSPLAMTCIHCGRPLIEVNPPQFRFEARYRWLRALAMIYRVVGVLAFLGGIAPLLAGTEQGSIGLTGPAMIACLTAIIVGITCLAIAEAVIVFISIEDNTRTIGNYLAHPGNKTTVERGG